MSASKSKSKSCVVTGTIIAIALTALMCGVYALLVKNGKLTDAYSEIIISASIALAVFIGALLSNPRQGRRGVSGLAVGIIDRSRLGVVDDVRFQHRDFRQPLL